MPIIHVTGSTSRDERIDALAAGSDEFVGKPFDIEELLTRVRSLLRTRRLTSHLVSAEAVMIALARTVEARDLYTERHLYRVANRAVSVATRLGVVGPAIETVRLGGLLHDLGKIGVPDRVLLKPGTADARGVRATSSAHPAIGRGDRAPAGAVLGARSRSCSTTTSGSMATATRPACAGRRFRSRRGSCRSRTRSTRSPSDRPYRLGQSPEVALQVLRDGRGTQWDPDVVDAFTDVYAGDEAADPAATGAAGGLTASARAPVAGTARRARRTGRAATNAARGPAAPSSTPADDVHQRPADQRARPVRREAVATLLMPMNRPAEALRDDVGHQRPVDGQERAGARGDQDDPDLRERGRPGRARSAPTRPRPARRPRRSRGLRPDPVGQARGRPRAEQRSRPRRGRCVAGTQNARSSGPMNSERSR